jgi:hypothetical protein
MKKKYYFVILFLILAIFLSGCGVTGPKTAKINITIEPNPVPYSSENESWPFDIVLDESNGVGVTLTSLRFDSYNQQEQLFFVQILYEEDIIGWFGSNYLYAFSALQASIYHTSTVLKYGILTVEGVDDNENLIEATGRVDYLPQ